jgi:hypothetical protein
MGYDLSLTRAPIEPIKEGLLRRCDAQGYHIIHTREGIGRICRTCPPTSAGGRSGSARALVIRALRQDPGAWRAWLGHYPELAPVPGEPVIDKPGKGIVLRHRSGTAAAD